MDISRGIGFEVPMVFMEWGLTKQEFINQFAEGEKLDETRSFDLGRGLIFGVMFSVTAYFLQGRFEGLELRHYGMEGKDFEALLRKYFGSPSEIVHEEPWESRGLWAVGDITVTFCKLRDERYPRNYIRLYRNKNVNWH